MLQAPQRNDFYRVYDLQAARNSSHGKEPAPHQQLALEKLHAWYNASRKTEIGGMLVLPTGGGKTFTAMHFICRRPLSDGHKVLWLAHTHHLLEQAYLSLGGLVGQIAEPRTELRARVVSGTPGHFKVSDIKGTDDVIVGTVQTIWGAIRNNHPRLCEFLESAKGKLFLVVDEAHHSPAPSYRQMVLQLRERFPGLRLLGLTATPTYMDERKSGWLAKLYPQGIVYEISPHSLMVSGVLAKPLFEERHTEAEADFDEREFAKWANTHQDIPESIVTNLAENQSRNDSIVSCYEGNRKKYGKTIIFADRWHQCVYLCEALKRRKVTADVVYSHVDADPGSAMARNRRTSDENAKVLRRFKAGEFDVLINVRMLTEGTDVPDVQTVFLTRQTTSNILLTQMVGRALRGPKFGGTSEAYIVSFIDNWKQRINWAEYGHLNAGFADEGIIEYRKRPPLSLISIELVQRLARQMDRGINMTPGPFLSLMPKGWYHVAYEAQVEGTDETEPVDRPVIVYDNEHKAFEKYIAAITKAPLAAFEGEDAKIGDVEDKLGEWQTRFFSKAGEHLGGEATHRQDLFDIARHIAQNDKRSPTFFPYEERGNYNLDAIAEQFITEGLGREQEDNALRTQYARKDRSWRIIYYNYNLFKSQYDACANRLLDAKAHGKTATPHVPIFVTPETSKDREPSDKLKSQIKHRDGDACLCCGYRRLLQVDHINASYFDGSNLPDNLQTLCKDCNRAKRTSEISFRNDKTTLREAPAALPELPLPMASERLHPPTKLEPFVCRTINFLYKCSAVSSVKIGKRGDSYRDWKVRLKPGNPTGWLRPHLRTLATRIRAARKDAGLDEIPKSISVE
jgi:superfamily II DNA or RNA helicase/5-methylcytosine-specific restriction endonuclease McrA